MSILMGKLSSEIRLIMSQDLTAGKWDLDGTLEQEVVTTECASTTRTPPPCKANLFTDCMLATRGLAMEALALCIVNRVIHILHVTDE